MILNIVHTEELDRWITENHYLHSTPAGAVIRMSFEVDGKRIGGMLWGRPSASKSEQYSLLQLSRMCFPDAEKNVCSQALSMARKHIRKHYPQIKGLITFASEGAGHEGIIYQADNWFLISKTKYSTEAKGWENRQKRTNRDLTPKLKYARSP